RDGRAPAYPFGFGLGYTSFAYRDLALERGEIGPSDTLAVSLEIENTGRVSGDEVVQLYIGAESSAVERAPRELAAFRRVSLAPGERRRVHFAIPASRLAYFDEAADDFVVEPGRYRLTAGRHERDEALTAELVVSSS